MTGQNETLEKQMPARWKMIVAVILIVLSLASALFIPVVVLLPLSAESKATISGLLVFGFPQAMMLIAVALVGKNGFVYLKNQIMGTAKKFVATQTVSKSRYYIGLTMFITPLLFGFFIHYLADLLPNYENLRIHYGVLSDLVLVCSFFVLGGDFWDKIKSLFIYNSKAQFEVSNVPQ